MHKPIVTVLAAALTGIAATPALAQEPFGAETTSVVVSYADLDLAKPVDNARLQSRIDNALDKVCARPDPRDLKATQAFEDCAAKSREAAMQQLSLNNPFEGLELASLF